MAWIETVVTVLSTGAGLKFLEFYAESRRKAKEADRTERKDDLELEKQRRDELKKELDETKKERDEHRKARFDAEEKLRDSGRFPPVKVDSVDTTLKGTGPVVAPTPVAPSTPLARRSATPITVLDDPDHEPLLNDPRANAIEMMRRIVHREVRAVITQEVISLRNEVNAVRRHVGLDVPTPIKPRDDGSG